MDRSQRPSYGIVDFLLWPLICVGLLATAFLLGERAGVTIPANVTGTAFYAGLASWLLHRAARPPYDIDLDTMSGRPKRRADWNLLLVVLPLVVTTAGALYLVTLALSFIVPERVAESLATPDSPSEVITLRTLPGDLIESAIGAVAEEWLFRGVLLHLWAQRFGIRLAVLASSILFAALHADVIGSLVFGIVMAALYVRTRTLLVPIVAHLLFNALVSVGAVLIGDEGTTTLAEFREGWWAGILAFASALAVIIVAVRRIAPAPWRLPDGPSGRSRERRS